MKLLEVNIGRTLSDIRCSSYLFGYVSQNNDSHNKNEWNLTELKSFSTAKETTNKMKRQPTEWEKTFANEATKKGLISEIYKYLMQLNIKKTNNSIKKMGRRSK